MSVVRVFAENRSWATCFFLGLTISTGHAPIAFWPVSLIGLTLFFGLYRLQWPQKSSIKGAFKRGWWLGFGYFLGTLNWLVEPFLVDIAAHGWMAPFAVVVMSGSLALFWGSGMALGAVLGGRLGCAIGLGLFEVARGYLFTGFPWGLLSYIWVDTPIAQLASYFGAYGLTVVTFGFCALFAQSFYARRKIIGLGSLLLVFLAVWIFHNTGGPNHSAPENATVIRLVQPNAPQDKKFDPKFAMDYFQRMLEFSQQTPQPDLIVWPETSLPIAFNFAADLILQIKEASQGVPVLVGALRAKDDKIYNSLILIDPQKDAEVIYDKYHLVPFGEYLPFEDFLAKIGLGFSSDLFGTGFQHGTGPKVVNLPNVGKIFPLICYEAVFPQDVSAMPERADMILQVTNDAWFGKFSGPYQHLAQAQMRSIEQGLPLVRVANTGVSGLIDPNGRVVKKLELDEAGYIDVALPKGYVSTFYSRFGHWSVFFLFICLGISNFIPRIRH